MRTLALQIYPDLVKPFSVNSFAQVISNISATASSWKWTLQEFVDFPCADPRQHSNSNWSPFTFSSSALVSEPVLTNALSKDGIQYLNSLSPGTDWNSLASTRRLTIAMFPALRYLERVICVSRCIIAVVCGEVTIGWTTAKLFYSGLNHARGGNRRHSVEFNFVDSVHYRDFHRVQSIVAGTSIYVRSGTFIQMVVQAGTMLTMIFDADVEPMFDNIDDWIIREKGEIY